MWKYSLSNILNEWRKHRQTVEKYSDDDSNTKILGMSEPLFIVLVIVSLALFVWNIIAIVKYNGAGRLSQGAFITALVFLILTPFGLGFIGSIISLAIIYSTAKPYGTFEKR